MHSLIRMSLAVISFSLNCSVSNDSLHILILSVSLLEWKPCLIKDTPIGFNIDNFLELAY